MKLYTQRSLPYCRSPPFLDLPASKKRKKGSDIFYIYLPDKQGGIPITADRLLRSIGASGRYTGFDYAVYMIEQVVSSQESIHLITKRFTRRQPGALA